MTGFEIFNLTSWLDSDGLVLQGSARENMTNVRSMVRKARRGVATAAAIGMASFSAASMPVQMELPFVTQSATIPPVTPIEVRGGDTDSATPAYWQSLSRQVASWHPVDDYAAVSPEPLD